MRRAIARTLFARKSAAALQHAQLAFYVYARKAYCGMCSVKMDAANVQHFMRYARATRLHVHSVQYSSTSATVYYSGALYTMLRKIAHAFR